MALELLLPKVPSQKLSNLEDKLFSLPSKDEIEKVVSSYKEDLGNDYTPLLNSLIKLSKEVESYYTLTDAHKNREKEKRKLGRYFYKPSKDFGDKRKSINEALQNMEFEFNYHRALLFGDNPTKEPLFELYVKVKYNAVRALGNDKQIEEALKCILISLNKKKASYNS